MPRGIVLIYFPIYQPGPLCAVNKNWMLLAPHQRETLRRERNRKRERRCFLTPARNFRSLSPESLFSVSSWKLFRRTPNTPFLHFSVSGSSLLQHSWCCFSSFFLLCLTLKHTQEKKKYLTCKVGFRVRLLFSLYLLWPFLILVYFFFFGFFVTFPWIPSPENTTF